MRDHGHRWMRAAIWLPLLAATPGHAQVQVEIRDPGADFMAAYDGGDLPRSLALIEPRARACIADAGGENADKDTLAPCIFLLGYYGMVLVEAGRSAEAVEMTRKAVESAADFGIESEVSVVANLFLGQVLERQGQHGAAEDPFTVALQGAEKVLAGDASLAGYVARRANNLIMLSRYAEALPHAERAVKIALDETERNVLSLVLGRALQGVGRLAEAEAVLRKAGAGLAATQGAQGVNTIELREALALNLEAQNRTDEAIALWRETLSIRRTAGRGPDIADTLSGLGAALMRTGQLREAEAVMREALTLRLRDQGEASSYTGIAYSNLALVLMESGQLIEAVKMFSRALAVLEAAGGANPEELVTILNNLAVVMTRDGGMAQAVDVQRRVLAVAIGHFGPTHDRTMLARNNLATSLMRLGQQAEARTLFEANYDAARGMGGAGAQWRAMATFYLGVDRELDGDRAAAKDWYARALAEARSAYREDHRERINVNVAYARFLIEDQDGLPLARTLLRDAARQVLARSGGDAGFDARARDEMNAHSRLFREQVRTAWGLTLGKAARPSVQ